MFLSPNQTSLPETALHGFYHLYRQSGHQGSGESAGTGRGWAGLASDDCLKCPIWPLPRRSVRRSTRRQTSWQISSKTLQVCQGQRSFFTTSSSQEKLKHVFQCVFISKWTFCKYVCARRKFPLRWRNQGGHRCDGAPCHHCQLHWVVPQGELAVEGVNWLETHSSLISASCWLYLCTGVLISSCFWYWWIWLSLHCFVFYYYNQANFSTVVSILHLLPLPLFQPTRAWPNTTTSRPSSTTQCSTPVSWLKTGCSTSGYQVGSLESCRSGCFWTDFSSEKVTLFKDKELKMTLIWFAFDEEQKLQHSTVLWTVAYRSPSDQVLNPLLGAAHRDGRYQLNISGSELTVSSPVGWKTLRTLNIKRLSGSAMVDISDFRRFPVILFCWYQTNVIEDKIHSKSLQS